MQIIDDECAEVLTSQTLQALVSDLGLSLGEATVNMCENFRVDFKQMQRRQLIIGFRRRRQKKNDMKFLM